MSVLLLLSILFLEKWTIERSLSSNSAYRKDRASVCRGADGRRLEKNWLQQSHVVGVRIEVLHIIWLVIDKSEMKGGRGGSEGEAVGTT